MKRAAAAVVAAVAVVAASCREPTEITLVLRTDAPCADVKRVSVYVGDESAQEATDTSTCNGGAFGTLALVPSGADDATVKVHVVADFGDPSGCAPPAYGPKCVVARRQIRYVPHTPLTLPIDLRAACEGILCDPATTCVTGTCKSAVVTSPEACAASDACGEGTLPPAPPTPPPPTGTPPPASPLVTASSQALVIVSPSATVSISRPSEVLDGDTMFVVFYAGGGSGTISGPASWQQLGNTLSDQSDAFRTAAFAHVAAPGETDATFTIAPAALPGIDWVLLAYRGLGALPPPIILDYGGSNGQLSLPNAPVTTSRSLVVLLYADGSHQQLTSARWVPPAGFEPRVTENGLFATDELFVGSGAGPWNAGPIVTSGPPGDARLVALVVPLE